ncbi:MAG: cation diffusion facilitator family transporter [Lachnospiraceae bacterium]|nr:cation diffusion facilitator family transporter [Lachnospiraceae bacterium]
MVRLLSRFFIPNRDDYGSPEVRGAYGVLCGVLGIVLNLLLFIGKFTAGVLSASVAITADAFNNLSDAGSSVITLIGFRLAGKKQDRDHPFGHGRMEYLSGLFVSVAIILMGFELIKSSFEKILHPEAIEFNLLSVVILVVSIAVKLYMSYYNRSVGKKIGSAAMTATATDSLSDSIATTVVLIATLVGHFFNILIDGWCGIIVAVFIMIAGIRAAKDTIDPLLGLPPEPEFVDEIEMIVTSHEGILGIHDLIVHDYGPGRRMISLHAEVPASSDILETHDTIDNIEAELSAKLNCAAVIHMDPIDTGNEKIGAMRDYISKKMMELGEEITVHDFRMVTGPTHTNLIFDVVVPFGFHLSDDEVRKAAKSAAESLAEGGEIFFAVVNIDKSYVRQDKA